MCVGLNLSLIHICRCLITDEFSDISINDMHIIEAIGVDEPKLSLIHISLIYSVTYNGSYLAAEGIITIIVISIPPVKKALDLSLIHI